MKRTPVAPLDLAKLQVYPLAERQSLTRVEDILIAPAAPPRPLRDPAQAAVIQECAKKVRAARDNGRSVMLVYGAHLLRNGAALLLDELMGQGYLTHLATNGAGTIHDWEYAWFGASTESVEMGVAGGKFGTWHETALNIHVALMAGALDGLGYGRALGRLIHEDGVTLPSVNELRELIHNEPAHPLTAARADLLQAMLTQQLPAGRIDVKHPHKRASILGSAYKHGVPLTVHPGIGYDIIANHPIFSGSVIGRGGELDFKLFCGSVANLEGGVLLSVGSAIMGPQVFEKSISCVNNLRLQAGQPVISDLGIYVVDLQDGGNWDWKQGEPPKTNPAYYLRFCKSYSRMGGQMQYLQCDNLAFIQHLAAALRG
ncbi:hypothetical protein [Anatilimnocola floriformis]|uniref:hypothetical protein n=1 Tax=Anatilimnocola floriformis TaxID=2948575 RepID=UPI0020C51D01|nr:hypothetical protein [Anatilimnocola floriformis]